MKTPIEKVKLTSLSRARLRFRLDLRKTVKQVVTGPVQRILPGKTERITLSKTVKQIVRGNKRRTQ